MPSNGGIEDSGTWGSTETSLDAFIPNDNSGWAMVTTMVS